MSKFPSSPDDEYKVDLWLKYPAVKKLSLQPASIVVNFNRLWLNFPSFPSLLFTMACYGGVHKVTAEPPLQTPDSPIHSGFSLLGVCPVSSHGGHPFPRQLYQTDLIVRWKPPIELCWISAGIQYTHKCVSFMLIWNHNYELRSQNNRAWFGGGGCYNLLSDISFNDMK